MAGKLTVGRRSTTSALLTGCAVAALFAGMPQQAAAQSFNGTPQVVAGDAGITTGPGTTTVDVFLPETVINWYSFADVDPKAIDFQPAGTTAKFVGSANVGDYTVLNRILPLNGNSLPTDATVAFNGTVSSTLFGGAPGGNIWFYSPTGIIAGPTATFNVGSLILTTDDIQFVPGVPDISNGSIYGPGGVIQFRGAPDSTGFVDIQPRAQITASGNSAYVALVAPRVQQGGSVSADGPIGYVGAEQVDLTINAGLFDIAILAGTTDPNGVVHTGTTTGPASTSFFDQQQIMMVAMPKATALTMLLSGSIGYTPAASAFDDGSSIILSAGYAKPIPTVETADSLGKISIDNATFGNPVRAYATGNIAIKANEGAVSFGSSANLFAQDAIDVTLAAGQSLSAAEFLSFNAGRSGKGGTIDIAVGPDAFLTTGGYLDLNTSSNVVPFGALATVDAFGGAVTVDVNGGTLSATGITGSANAYGGYDPLLGGLAQAGSTSFTARNGGTISGSYLSAVAYAYGGSSDEIGGDAIAGSGSLSSLNGIVDLDSFVVDARAYGGSGTKGSGAATGGKATLLLDGGTYDWDDVNLLTDAYASFGDAQGNGAQGLANAIDVSLLNGATVVLNQIDLSADAFGSFDAPGDSFVRAGGIDISLASGSSLTFANLSATADADINVPFLFFDSAGPATTPDTFGGTISLTADGATISGQSAGFSADAYQLGALDDAGTATGGTVAFSLLNESSLTLNSGEGSSSLNLSAGGYGAIGESAADATGGTASLTISDSSVNVSGTINVMAAGAANDFAALVPSGSNPVGFNTTGGTATVSLLSSGAGTTSLTASELIVDASGDASTPEFYFNGGEAYPTGYYGGPFQADGGVGTGGTATLNLAGGVFTVDDTLITADGYGGLSAASFSGSPFRSGDGHGGTAAMTMSDGSNTIGSLTISAAGYGGDGSPTGDVGTVPALAGDGFGGYASLTVGGGMLQAGILTLDASGFGGVGGDGPDDSSDTAATDGGTGTGGTARLVSTAGNTGQLTIPSLTITSSGIGGSGGVAAIGSNGSGGNGMGGTAEGQFADGAFALGPITINADGTGGDGVDGGEGSGGIARFLLDDTGLGPGGTRTIEGLSLSASGLGGNGTGGIAQSDAGLVQLSFDAAGPLTIDGDLVVVATGSRSASGDGFNGGFSGTPIQVTGDTSINTTRDATITATAPLQTGGNLQITARKLSGTGQFGAGGFASIDADQGIALDKLSAGTTTTLHATNGAVSIADLRSSGLVGVFARSIDITSGAGLDFEDAIASAGNLAITTQLDLSTGSATATGDVSLRSLGGDIHTIGHTGGAAITLEAAGDVQVDHSLDASGAFTVAAGGTFGLGATAQGSSIDVTSHDIQLNAGSQLGVRGITRDIALTNSDGARVAHFGGESGAGGYDLDSAEAARLFADNSLTLNAAGDVVVGGLQLSFGTNGNIGTGGTLEVTTGGDVEISGAVDLATSSDDDTFSIDPGRIDIIAGEGSIAMHDGTGTAQGLINLEADFVTILTRATRDAILGLTDLGEISAFLDAPAAPGPTGGYLQAGTIRLFAGDQLLIQNGGASSAIDDRRGFTANAVDITTGGAATQIAINGVILQNGAPVTGLATAPLVTINGLAAAAGGQFDPLSTINGCVIGGSCGPPPPPDTGPDYTPPANDDLEPPVTPDHPGNGTFASTLIELQGNEPLISPPLVDEPITGVGNDDLWVPECKPGSQQEGCPQQDGAQ
jgi:filamentous hemagglutinin family protein